MYPTAAYRLDFKEWQARGKDNETMKIRKMEMQKRFRTEMGLIVDTDRPKPGGSGTSNDGNTARRFFANIELAASITGVDAEIIRRFAVSLYYKLFHVENM